MKEIISTPNAPAAIGPYSQAVRAGSLLFVSGQIPLDPASGQLVENTIQAQAARSLENLKGHPDPGGRHAGQRGQDHCVFEGHGGLCGDEPGV